MKKKLALFLATLMCISLCACGGTESTSGNNTETKAEESTSASNTETKAEANGFVPEKATETEEIEETEVLEIDEQNLEQYYDVTQFVGTPRLEVLQTMTIIYALKEDITLVDKYNEAEGMDYVTQYYKIGFTDKLEGLKDYNCIIVDNNTPDDKTDDSVAYVFTIPVE